MQLISFALFTTLASALPTAKPQDTTDTPCCDVSQQQFYLVTTTSPACSSNSSLLPAVSATSIFAPMHQANLFLRTIDPGYNSLPVFTFGGGKLQTWATDGFGQGNFSYTSKTPADGEELQLLQGDQGDSGLGLQSGLLLTWGGDAESWTLCQGALGETVIKWKGDLAAGCNATYIQAVSAPPY